MTVPHTTTPNLLATPFVSSWFGTARKETSRFSSNFELRTQAWAQWALESIVEMVGARDRAYPAIVLEGKFHDPKGTGPLVTPHLEIPTWVLEKPEPHFPAKLAAAGSGLAFPWWLIPEVTAVKRSIFSGGWGDPSFLLEALGRRRSQLAAHVDALADMCAPTWGQVEELLMNTADGLSKTVTSGFSTEEISTLLPEAKEMSLEVQYDERLAEKSQQWASRRVGVWTLRGSEGKRNYSVPAVTPRLTANSQFNDPLFHVKREAPAALLVRALLLRRLASQHLGLNPDSAEVAEVAAPARNTGTHLRALSARVGSKLPEASPESAVGFLTTYPLGVDAWAVLTEFAERAETALTVDKTGFLASHKRASGFVRRLADPDRDDINVLLPLGWDKHERVVRITFAKHS